MRVEVLTAGARRQPPRQQRAAARGANRVPGVEVGEAHALRRHAVDVRRLGYGQLKKQIYLNIRGVQRINFNFNQK